MPSPASKGLINSMLKGNRGPGTVSRREAAIRAVAELLDCLDHFRVWMRSEEVAHIILGAPGHRQWGQVG